MSNTSKRHQKSLSRRRRIARRLATYSVAAGAAAFAGGQAEAAIVYHALSVSVRTPKTQVIPSVLPNEDLLPFGAAGNEFAVAAQQWFGEMLLCSGSAPLQVVVKANGLNGVGAAVVKGAAINSAAVLAAQQQVAYRKVSASFNQWYFKLPNSSPSWNNFPAGNNNFLPLKLHMDDGDHYGWLRFTVADDPTSPESIKNSVPALHRHVFQMATLQGWAYQATPGQAIVAGAAIDGDANLDGIVDGADLNTVLSNYNQTGRTWSQGDFDGDGAVNGVDYNIVLSNYNQSAGLSAAVPEPGTLGMLALGAVGVLAWKSWRREK